MRTPGKRMGSKIYLHISCDNLIPPLLLRFAHEALIQWMKKHNKKLNPDPPPASPTPLLGGYDVVCWDKKTGSLTFTTCHSFFDSEEEPIIKKQIRVDSFGNAKVIKQPKDPRVFHHKWMMVRDDYEGFDVQASKDRSAWWSPLVDKKTKSRIGSWSVWQSVLSRLQKDQNPVQCH